MNDVMLWVEKYRPSTISECVLTDDLKKTFQQFVDDGHIPNLLLSGGAGVGKTTVAKAMLDEIGATYMLINGSEESGIDVLRNKIKNFASTVSMDGNRKFVILDEADYLNPQSTQPALRGFIEEFSNNCRFILTCNFKNRIIEPLHSRCGVYEFNTSKKSMIELCESFMARCKTILDNEKIEYDDKPLAELIMKFAPDWRRVLTELQRYSINGRIDSGVVANLQDKNFDDLFSHLKNKNFKSMRSWVVNNIDTDASAIFRAIYDRMIDKVAPQSIPQLVLLLADYQYKNAFVADHELNVVACLTEVMSDVQFN